MPLSSEQLDQKASQATDLLRGKVVSRVVRHREAEVLLEFTDSARLFVDQSQNGIELSITEGSSSHQLLTSQQAFFAMLRFLENYYASTGSGEIGALLGSLSLLPNGSPVDTAQIRNWEAAVQFASSGNVQPKQIFEP